MKRRDFLRGAAVAALVAPAAKLIDLGAGEPFPNEDRPRAEAPVIEQRTALFGDQMSMTTISTCDTLDAETLRQLSGSAWYRGGA